MGRKPAKAIDDGAAPASGRPPQPAARQFGGKFAVVPLRDVDFTVTPRTAKRLKRIADSRRLALGAMSRLVLR